MICNGYIQNAKCLDVLGQDLETVMNGGDRGQRSVEGTEADLMKDIIVIGTASPRLNVIYAEKENDIERKIDTEMEINQVRFQS